ncbi:dihydrodipicolinate synthase family protein [bacterium]|nr:dihydrodipicolinate synthase family protein [bacterium]
MKTYIKGLVAATFTPLTDDGLLDLDRVPELVDHLVTSGVSGIYINGTTGEGVSFTVDERCAAAEAYVSASGGRLKTLVQVGHECLPEAIRLATHAASLKVNAISATPPCYFKPTSLDLLLDYLEPLAAAASEVPFYYYHIPAMTAVSFDPLDFLKEASRRVPTLGGIKYSDTDLAALRACLEHEDGAWDVLYGCDEALLGALATGCEGAVGSTYNFAAPIYLRMWEAFERGDLDAARQWQGRSVRMVRALVEVCGGRPGLKPMMAMIGQDCGPHRLPQRDPLRGQLEELRQRLESMGFYQWISGDDRLD